MPLAEDDVRTVKERTDLVALLSERGLGLKREGRSWKGLCPFHQEKSPSFFVNPQLGTYHCFGCNAHGDAISFLRETAGMGFVEAVEHLAGRAGVALQQEDPGAAQARKRRGQLLEAVERAAGWFHERLLTAPDAAAARAYLRSRGYDGEVVRRFRLGWAPDAWDELSRALRLPDDVLVDTGLGHVDERGRRTDAFRGRVLFPILDHTGAVVAFGGRQLPGGRPPKYKNSSETPLYKKSEVLYGLSWAKDRVLREGVAVLCEGYTDVIAFHRSGVDQAVATCGTAATDAHVRRLKAFGATKLVLGYDADAAGQGAAERFYAWEDSLGLDIRVLDLPAGTDPADVAASDPAALQRAVEAAVPFLAFRLRRLWAMSDLRTNEGRSRAARQAVALVAQHPSPLVRDQYLMEVADLTRTDPARLRQVASGPVAPVVDHRPAPRRPTLPRIEEAVLWFAVNEPDAVGHLLEEELFDHELSVGAFRALVSAETFDDAVASADADVASILARLSVEPPPADDPTDVLVALARLRAREALNRPVRADLAPDELALRAAENASLFQDLERLGDPDDRPEALERLVAWLVGHRREG